MITIGMLGLVCSGVIRVVGNLVMPWRAHSAGGNR
jgi:NitT/TauT family transport system permease protein